MIYRAIGLMSGSSLDGLDIVFAEILENGGKWNYEIIQAECLPYDSDWKQKLQTATTLPALEYQLLHVDYGHYLGQCVNDFISRHQLQFKVAVVASHGHTTFHLPAKKMTAQLGDGAAIAATTQLPVVSDLRAMDVAFGGQGAPIVPIGEQLFFPQYAYFLNIGGIANLSINEKEAYKAFDICAANRVLNMLANEAGQEFDKDGALARSGQVNQSLLNELNGLSYYGLPFPKSLANSFGTDTVFPLIKKYGLSVEDSLRTYVAHIVRQIKNALMANRASSGATEQLLVTGGGALNGFLIEQLSEALRPIEVVVPDDQLVQYKEALIMALIGVLRWREEYNVLSSVTGASRNSVGGAMWMGQEE
ncbi:anhydro-N-acetylmuramic acid kinase [Niabella insulamsoli]|uniref:anhydro-N-acetylmuramic acid kinase n=1 Tax=Niabella insulamsoli TaxID=3144874 RepID=UPI0031FE0FCC